MLALGFGLLWTLSSGIAAAPAKRTAASLSPIVETKDGRIQGIVSNGVVKFLGIPYAKPPIGDLRWRPPTDQAPWTNVRQARRFAPICALTTTLGVFSGPRNDNEDCLYLNIFTPKTGKSASLPVIVYIHGGGNFDGETPGYDGSMLASQGNVVVTMEYRLNLMGFLAHPALDDEGHPFGNYGILDQQAALRWVQRNIAGFGGDRNNVTVGGQSSGALDTMIHMVSPLAAGLFHKAICQSSCQAAYPLASKTEAEAIGVSFATAAGCGAGAGPDVARCLRKLPAAKIEELAGTASATSKFVIASGIVDGNIVPDQPLTLFKNGRFHHVPFVNGGTTDEANFSLSITQYWTHTDNTRRTPPTADQYVKYVDKTFVPPSFVDGTASEVLALYPVGAYSSPQSAWNRVTSDALRLCNLRKLNMILAPQIPVYGYQFADETAPSYSPDMPGMRYGAYHTADIQYLFPGWRGGPQGIERSLSRPQKRLSDQIVALWTNFARTGNPNGTGDKLWPRYTGETGADAWLIQDIPNLSRMTDKDYSSRHHCDFWDSVRSPR